VRVQTRPDGKTVTAVLPLRPAPAGLPELAV
jgi:hypothetical protein